MDKTQSSEDRYRDRLEALEKKLNATITGNTKATQKVIDYIALKIAAGDTKSFTSGEKDFHVAHTGAIENALVKLSKQHEVSVVANKNLSDINSGIKSIKNVTEKLLELNLKNVVDQKKLDAENRKATKELQDIYNKAKRNHPRSARDSTIRKPISSVEKEEYKKSDEEYERIRKSHRSAVEKEKAYAKMDSSSGVTPAPRGESFSEFSARINKDKNEKQPKTERVKDSKKEPKSQKEKTVKELEGDIKTRQQELANDVNEKVKGTLTSAMSGITGVIGSQLPMLGALFSGIRSTYNSISNLHKWFTDRKEKVAELARWKQQLTHLQKQEKRSQETNTHLKNIETILGGNKAESYLNDYKGKVSKSESLAHTMLGNIGGKEGTKKGGFLKGIASSVLSSLIPDWLQGALAGGAGVGFMAKVTSIFKGIFSFLKKTLPVLGKLNKLYSVYAAFKGMGDKSLTGGREDKKFAAGMSHMASALTFGIVSPKSIYDTTAKLSGESTSSENQHIEKEDHPKNAWDKILSDVDKKQGKPITPPVKTEKIEKTEKPNYSKTGAPKTLKDGFSNFMEGIGTLIFGPEAHADERLPRASKAGKGGDGTEQAVEGVDKVEQARLGIESANKLKHVKHLATAGAIVGGVGGVSKGLSHVEEAKEAAEATEKVVENVDKVEQARSAAESISKHTTEIKELKGKLGNYGQHLSKGSELVSGSKTIGKIGEFSEKMGPILGAGVSIFNIAKAKKEYDEGEITGKEKNKKEWGAVGGAAGGLGLTSIVESILSPYLAGLAATGAGAIPAAIIAAGSSVLAFGIGAFLGDKAVGEIAGKFGSDKKKAVKEGGEHAKKKAGVGETLSSLVFGTEAHADERLPRSEKGSSVDAKKQTLLTERVEAKKEILAQKDTDIKNKMADSVLAINRSTKNSVTVLSSIDGILITVRDLCKKFVEAIPAFLFGPEAKADERLPKGAKPPTNAKQPAVTTPKSLNDDQVGKNTSNDAVNKGDKHFWDSWFGGDKKTTTPTSPNSSKTGGDGVVSLKGDKKTYNGKSTKSSDQNQLAVFNSFKKAGLSDAQAKALTSEVGRENNYQDKFLFGSHTDSANGAKNSGIMSWQKDRAVALNSYLKSKNLLNADGSMKKGQETLDAQAEFVVKEMRETKRFSKTKEGFLNNPNVDKETARNLLQKNYVVYGPGRERLNSFDAQLERNLANSTSNQSPNVAQKPTPPTPKTLVSAKKDATGHELTAKNKAISTKKKEEKKIVQNNLIQNNNTKSKDKKASISKIPGSGARNPNVSDGLLMAASTGALNDYLKMSYSV